MNDVLIQQATPADIPAILEIYNHSIIHTTSVYRDRPCNLDWMTQWFEEKENESFPVLVAIVNKQIAGFASYGQFRSWPGYLHTVEHSLHVHPSFRRLGLAKALMQELISKAQEAGLHVMIGGVDADNQGSIDLHEKLGFKKVGLLPEVGRKFDRWLDLQFMQLML